MQYDWTLEGAIPNSSIQQLPAIKYTEPGEYEVVLDYHNVTGAGMTQTASIVVLPGCKVSQQEQYDNVWPMGLTSSKHGHAAGLDFSNGEPIQGAFNNPFLFNSAASSICDVARHLQFSSNGKDIVTPDGISIASSEGFNLGDSTILQFTTLGLLPQLLTILPSAIESRLYYILHTPQGNSLQPFARYHNELQLSIVDMTLNDGKGAMTLKNLPLVQDRLQQSFLQASRHCNCEDWWVVVGKYNSDACYTVLLTADGQTTVTEQSLGV